MKKKLIGMWYEKVRGIYDGRLYDLDRYIVEMRSPLATHEYTITVDHIARTITGDCIRYGSVDIIGSDDTLEILEIVEEQDEIQRPFDGYLVSDYGELVEVAK